jgi:hypothetical protein
MASSRRDMYLQKREQKKKHIRYADLHQPPQVRYARIFGGRNEKADRLAEQAAGKVAWSRTASLSHLKLRISERFSKAKEEWHKNPKHHGKDEIPPPVPKKSCMDARLQFYHPGCDGNQDWALEVSHIPQKD